MIQFTVPYEIRIFQNSLIEWFVFVKVLDLWMLLTPVQMLFNLNSPFVDLLYEINSHLAKSRHISKDVTDSFDWFFDRIIDVDNRIPLHFDPVDISSILFRLSIVLLREQSQKRFRFRDISLDFIYASFSCFYTIIDDMQKTPAFSQSFILPF